MNNKCKMQNAKCKIFIVLLITFSICTQVNAEEVNSEQNFEEQPEEQTTDEESSTPEDTNTQDEAASEENSNEEDETTSPEEAEDVGDTEETQEEEMPGQTTSESEENPTVQIPQVSMEIITQSQINETAASILNYLKSQQSMSGGIVAGYDENGKPMIDGPVTDWAIISFGANGQYADEIKMATTSLLDYEKKYNLDDPSDINSCATYPRHVLALLAAGVEQTDPAILGLKEKMNTICYANNMYGLNGINDDVFALLALSALGTNQSEPIMQDIVSTTLAWQIDTGAFAWPDWTNPNQKVAGDDITGAAINALAYAESKGAMISPEVLNNAKNYLKTTQQTDGGWGYGSSDIMTTSWVLMGIHAMNETQDDWFVTSTGKNPWHPLVYNLKSGGYYEPSWALGTVDWFAMKHAVPAVLGTSWPIMLNPVVKDFSHDATFTYGSSGGSYIPPQEDIIATSTIIMVTSTQDMVTTTEDIIATTTEDIITEIQELDSDKNNDESTVKIVPAPSSTLPIPQQPKPIVRGEKITDTPDEQNTTSTNDVTDEKSAEIIPQEQKTEGKKDIPALPILISIGGIGLLYGAWKLIKTLL
ncbi:MAG TPA: hypothetical protein DCS29_00420 [Candidatus Magasanikbacteria bacterium]|nr:MAG: hypothetical protein A2479_03645 [Candidatus Magasanikbacteria bacterium RIFOXYC2_FULL_39_8]HAT03229.1 hypothetical protein [Candidatus Magasanikbacteria bacterium]